MSPGCTATRPNKELKLTKPAQAMALRSLTPVFYSSSWGDEAEAVPGVDTARRLGMPRTGCAAPNLRRAVTGYGTSSRCGEQVHLVGLVPRPTYIELGP